jgi:hypothetical protein
MIVALVGRRLDDKDASMRRFPEANEELVRARIREMLEQQLPSVLVTSAASGADLIGLEEAGAKRVRRRVVLPLEAGYFRATSVANQGEKWGARFDAVRLGLESSGDFFVAPAATENEPDQEAYLRVVRTLLDESLSLARQELADEGAVDISPASRVVAVVIWDGVSHGDDDASAAFIAEAQARGIAVQEISTL